MRVVKIWWCRALLIATVTAAAFALTTCSEGSDTGLWLRIISPEVSIDRAVVEVYDAVVPATTPLAEGEVVLPEARTFKPSPNEPPEDQLWILILADPGETERVRIYGSGYREGINRKIAEGYLEGVSFSPNKIIDHPVPLELTHSGADDDKDGFYVPEDCDDTRAEVNPEAQEVCDGLDNNCDGTNDEGCDCTPGEQRVCWPHWAGLIGCEIGAADCPCHSGTQTCQGGLWGPCENLAMPDQEGGSQPCPDDSYACYPTCSDGVDNDCDGALDDRDPDCGGCEPGSDRSCYTGPPGTEGVGQCQPGRQYCVDGKFGPCEGEMLPDDKESCDGHDNDCDGDTDEFEPEEMPSCAYNVGVCEGAKKACIQEAGVYFWKECSPEDYQSFADDLVCDGADPPACCPGNCYQTPETVAFCDDLDNDCDGRADNASDGTCACSPNGKTRPYSLDEGECEEGTEICENGGWEILVEGVLPIPELCDNLDNDCDTITDQNADAEEDCRVNHPRDHMHVLGCTAGICLRACDVDPPNYCWGNCDATDDNGCETALSTLSNCGSCGSACARPHATATCATCSCRIGSCDSLWGNCDGNDGNGCETPLNTLDDCGQCGIPCRRAHATPTCATGNCRIESCNYLWDNCDGLDLNGCETSLETLSDCGSCDTSCSRAHATATCVGGNCRIGSCNHLWGNCDANDDNGCETSLQTLSNCGTCGAGCTRTHATASCEGGSCHIDSCNDGWGDCDGSDPNGCENSLDSLSHCGSCGTSCSRANATASCSGDVCHIASCNSGFGNCDGVDSNGCEANFATDPNNCGSCGSCSRANAIASCSGDVCHIGSCNSGWGDCDGIDSNGCENSLDSLSHCGSCGTPCSRQNATASCSGDVCHIETCNAGWDNCDGVDSNGCEANLNTDEQNCGGCGNSCGQNAFCSVGSCACNSGYANCDGFWSTGCEVNTNTDPNNCGGCGNDCGQNAHCSGGNCACNSGYANCDGNWNDGCEINTTNDPNNCGQCDFSCGQYAACLSSTCTCISPYENCDGSWGNGCEVNTDTDVNNCGWCNHDCGQNAHCSTGSCTCNLGFGNCDSDWSDGCETTLGTTENCNGCGDSCGPTSDTACILGLPNHCGCNDGNDCAATGEYCDTGPHLCAACTVAAHCGDACDNCFGETYDKACINDGGTYRCGCNGNGDCGGSKKDCDTDTNYCY